MSRSYKKTPYCGDHKGKSKKRIANHKVRNWLKQNPEVALKGNAYKKIYESCGRKNRHLCGVRS